MKSEKIRINGLNHQFYFWGAPKKPKLFLLHGWLDTGASFDFLCPYLEKDFYCIAPDMRGYGKSEHGKSVLGYFFYEYVADVHAILNYFSPKSPVKILGHSLGGAIASFYAGAFPERVSHFINVEGFAVRDNPPDRAPEKVRKWIEEMDSCRFQRFPDLKSLAQRLIQNNPCLSEERALFLARYLGKKVRTSPKSSIMMAADPLHKLSDPYALPKEYHFSFWEKIKARCLLVYAEKSEMNVWVQTNNLEAQLQEWRSHFPSKSDWVVIQDCGHMVHHEKPEALAREARTFLR